MVLKVLPDNLNEVEFGAVRRQMHQHQAMFDQPFVQFFGVDVVMDLSIVQHDQRQRHPLVAFCDAVDQGDYGITLDGLAVQVVPHRAGNVVQRADHVDPRPWRTGIGGMGLAFGRPSPLYIGYRAEAALVQVKQAQFACPGRVLATLEVGVCGLELVRAAFFFNDSRVRVKDRPRFFSPFAKQSRLNGGASGWRSRNAWSMAASVQGAARAIPSAVSSSVAVNFAGAPP
jgi:hypothetical protein